MTKQLLCVLAALACLVACGPPDQSGIPRVPDGGRDAAETADTLAADVAEDDGKSVDTADGDTLSDTAIDTADGDTVSSDTAIDTADDTSQPPADVPTDVSDDATMSGSPGCADGAGLDEGEHTFMLDGFERRFIVRLPNGYTNQRTWPLVLALHGNGGDVSYWDSTGGSRDLRGAVADDAILIVAEAIGGNWRDYDEPSESWPARIDLELTYFDEVLTQASAGLCLNEAGIFAMGFSGGGSFSGVLGCRRDDIRAIAVGGSVIYFDTAQCVGSPAAWITIGTEELTAGRETYRDFFRDRAACGDTTVATEPSPCVAYDGCGGGTPVHYCQHPGGHVWPDFGTDAAWAFFQQVLQIEP